jgi:hypothetical protein
MSSVGLLKNFVGQNFATVSNKQKQMNKKTKKQTNKQNKK